MVPSAFLAYIMTTLAVIQIWNYSTYYINIYGRHGIREHVFLFINMFLLVFTFGEMIITIASYFEGDFSLHDIYFALMAFLIVAELFLSYGVFYDHIIDREQRTNGLYYMFLHIFIIFALNNITNGLEFMAEEEISLMPKIVFLVASFVLFFVFLFALGARYAKARCKKYDRFCLFAVLISAGFAVLMCLLRNNMMLNIALSVVFVFLLFAIIYHYGKEMEALKEV